MTAKLSPNKALLGGHASVSSLIGARFSQEGLSVSVARKPCRTASTLPVMTDKDRTLTRSGSVVAKPSST
jgi:hypothetical protein